MVLNANPADPDFLEEEALARANACILATGDDHRNLLVGTMLRERGTPTCITELAREEYIPLAHRLGIQACVVPRVVTASFILQLVERRNVRSLTLLAEGQAEILELVVEAGARAAGRPVARLGLPPGVVIGLIIRGGPGPHPPGRHRHPARGTRSSSSSSRRSSQGSSRSSEEVEGTARRAQRGDPSEAAIP